MKPKAQPLDDALWVTMQPQAAQAGSRDRFIRRAAEHVPGALDWQTIGGVRRPRVLKSFYNAMQSCPMPQAAITNPKYIPRREDFFAHLVIARLEGIDFEFSLEDCAP